MNTNTKINSADGFLKAILQKTSKFGDDDNIVIFWFRGESSIEFQTPLVPNAYRILAETLKKSDVFKSEQVKQIENNLNAEFYRRAIPYIASKGIENTKVNRYFLMQHYKIYTRLLDWTENALLALFFAITENKGKDAIVWILQPLELNNFTISKITGRSNYSLIPPVTDGVEPKELFDKKKLRVSELTRRYLNMDFLPVNKNKTYYPLAVYPPFLDERMDKQKACFTIFGNKIKGFDNLDSDNKNIIDSIIIDGKSKDKIQRELRLIGIDFDSIYPDLDGLGSSIISRYKKYFFDNRETIMHVLKSWEEKAE